MKSSVLLVILLVVAPCLCTMEERFRKFEEKFGKRYASDADRANHFRDYVTNMNRAAELQKINPMATFGETPMSDVDLRTRRFAGLKNAPTAEQRMNVEDIPNVDLPVKWDWRSHGAVTPVSNQGQCGDVCSFAITGMVEGMWKIAGHALVALSPQQLTSCVVGGEWEGCCGCENNDGYNWIISQNYGQLDTNASYPYTSGSGETGVCNMTGAVVGATIDSWAYLPQNETAMAQFLVAKGPINVCVDATAWSTYTGGVMTNCDPQQVNHCAVLVGYNDANASLPYWIIKNQWSTAWGVEGYIFLAKGVNECFITDQPTAATIGVPPPPTPSPPTPMPTSPPSLVETKFYDASCKDVWTSHTYPIGQCVASQHSEDSSSGTYQYATMLVKECGKSKAFVTFFDNQDCSGTGVTKSVPTNQCVLGGDFSTFTYKCLY